MYRWRTFRRRLARAGRWALRLNSKIARNAGYLTWAAGVPWAAIILYGMAVNPGPEFVRSWQFVTGAMTSNTLISIGGLSSGLDLFLYDSRIWMRAQGVIMILLFVIFWPTTLYMFLNGKFA